MSPEGPGPAAGRRLPPWAAPLACAAAAFLVFLPSVFHGWVDWDDALVILDAAGARGFSPRHLLWDFSAAPGGAYSPLSYLTYALDHALWGFDPRGFHLTSVLLHAANAALACVLTRRILSLASSERGADGLDLAAAFGALVFAVHPLRVESVSWAAERRDVLCGLFSLATALAYLDARAEGRRGALTLPLVLFAAAVFSKGTAVTLPLVLLVLDARLLGRPFVESAREKVPMLCVAAAAGVFGLWAQSRAGAVLPPSALGLPARAAQVAYALAFYARKTLWPAGLSPVYELRAPPSWAEPRFALSGLAVAAAAAGARLARRRAPRAEAALAAYALILAPASGVVAFGGQLAADRYSYLACLPFAVLAAGALRAASRRARAESLALAAVALAALAAACVAQQAHWRDSQSLWRRALAVDPGSLTARYNLALGDLAAGRLEAARRGLDDLLAADPSCAAAVERVGALSRAGRAGSEEARSLRAGLALRAVCRRAYADRAALELALGRPAAAAAALENALAADPADALSAANLGKARRAVEAPRRDLP